METKEIKPVPIWVKLMLFFSLSIFLLAVSVNVDPWMVRASPGDYSTALNGTELIEDGSVVNISYSKALTDPSIIIARSSLSP